MRISDWSSDVCSSDLFDVPLPLEASSVFEPTASAFDPAAPLLGSAVPAFDSAGLAAEPAGTGRFWSPDAASSRSEERRVGKECVSTCRSRWSPYTLTKKHH